MNYGGVFLPAHGSIARDYAENKGINSVCWLIHNILIKILVIWQYHDILVKTFLIVSPENLALSAAKPCTEYFQDEFIIIFDKNDTTQ